MRKYRWLGLAALAAWTLGDRTCCGQAQPAEPEIKVHDPATLEIGCTAPDIEAGDLDGVVFKLSDYRGRVVVLDFWGDW